MLCGYPYRVWLEGRETFETAWECVAVTVGQAIDKYREEADPPGSHTWDDELDESKEVTLVVARLEHDEEHDADYPGETCRVLMRCSAVTTVIWDKMSCEKVGGSEHLRPERNNWQEQ